MKSIKTIIENNPRRTLIKQILSEELSEVSTTIYSEINKINTNDAVNGLSHSGQHISNLTSMINKVVLDSLEKTLNIIIEKQYKLNIRYKKSDITFIIEETTKRYQSLANNFYRESNLLENELVKKTGVDRQVMLFLNNLLDNIQNRSNALIEAHLIESTIYRPSDAIKQAKWANRFSLAALIISIFSFVYLYIYK